MLLILTVITICNTTFAVIPVRQRLLDLPTIDLMRDLYRTYTPQERKLVWQDKLNQVVNLSCWNETQISLLRELQHKLSNASFDEGDHSYTEFKETQELWCQSALLSFTKVQIYNIVAVPHDFINTDAPIGAGTANSDCECNKGSAVSCVFGFGGDCNKALCAETKGCGFMWLWSCNGECGSAGLQGAGN